MKVQEKENEILKMLKETSKLYTDIFIGNQTELLANEVEFWKWLKANFPKNFSSFEKIKEQAINNSEWFKLQLQGKGYEWDFMKSQRESIKNIFSRFNAGTNPTQEGIDILKTNIFTGKTKNTYQNKAYYNKSNPNLKNTPKDATVVTTSEKVKYAQDKGFKTEEFLNAEQGKKAVDSRLKNVKDGKINIEYNFKNIGITMGKAGAVGFVIGVAVETLTSYKKWKNGEITTDEYLKEVLKSGGNFALNASMTSGIMIPISAKIVALGVSEFINFPVAIAISMSLDKIIAPAFGSGKYKEYLNEAKYYQNIDYFYKDFIEELINFEEEYKNFIFSFLEQEKEFESLVEINNELNNKVLEKKHELQEVLIKISGGKKK